MHAATRAGFHRRTSAGSGSSKDRTILSRSRVCDYWAAKPYHALAGELRARGGRFRGSGCRARFAAARGRLLGCGLFRVHDRWGIRKTWGLPGCVNADALHVVVLGALSTSAQACAGARDRPAGHRGRKRIRADMTVPKAVGRMQGLSEPEH